MNVAFFNEEIEDFIRGLTKNTISRVLRTIGLLEEFGHQLGMPHSKPLSNGLFELRVTGVIQVRFLYTFYNSEAIILIGFLKKTNKIPVNMINLANIRKRLLVDNR